MAQASFGYFGFGVETTPGTAVPPTKFLPVKDVDFPVNVEFIETREIRGSRQAYSNFDGPVRPDVSFTSSLYPSTAMGTLLRAMFGGVGSALISPSTTVWKHTFADAATLPSLSMERSDTRTFGTGNIFQRMNGVKLESMGFTANYGEDVEVSVSGQGLGFPVTPGSKPGAFTYGAMDPMIFTGAVVSIDGTPNNFFKSINFEFTNELERQESLRGTREAYRIYEGGQSCTLSGTLIFEDQTMYDNFKNATAFAVKATFNGAEIDATNELGFQFEVTWPKVKVSSFGLPMEAGGILEADVEFQVSYDFATNKLATVTMNTDENGSTYNA